MRIALVAGETSGDLLGAGLIQSLREQRPDATFEGVAGPAMIAAGCQPLAEAEELAVMGLVEPLKHLPRLLKLRAGLAKRWRENPPDVFVGIDAPDFNFGLEKRLKASGVRTIHYVSPSIWAWRAGRIETVRAACHRVLCLLPFEKTLYDNAGIDAVFVGHPKADKLALDIDPGSTRQILGIDDGPLIAVLPGSRMSEVSRLAPLFAQTAAQLLSQDSAMQFVTPVATPALREPIQQSLEDAGVTTAFTLIDGDSIEAMSAADTVLLASGTAALEAALLLKPVVAAYRVSALTAAILRLFRLLKTDTFTLPNLLVGERLVPEFIQEAATPTALAEAVTALHSDAERRAAVIARFAKLREELALGADNMAAQAVIDLAGQEI